MEHFYPFFLIIFAGVFLSMIVRRVHVPWVVGLILAGILIGPHAFNLLSITPTVEFIAQVGLVFLMFMAGLETKLSSFRHFQSKLLLLAFINGALPFAVGLATAYAFGYTSTSALLVGIIFISSSIAVVIPSLERHGLLHSRLGQSVIMTSVIQDIASLILLSIVLQSTGPVTSLPLYIFYPLVVIVLMALRFLLPRAIKLLTYTVKGTKDLFQQEFRATFLVLIGTVISFEILGLHPIIAGFFAGFVLSDSMKITMIKEKIRAVSYGIFIPTFFILIGAQVEIDVLRDVHTAIPLALSIIVASICSKFVSGWVSAKLIGFTSNQALLFGVSSIPQLSTTLAVASTSLALGIIDQQLITAMVALSIITVVVSPTLMNILEERITKSLDKDMPV